jgi:hypothetical protein
LSCVQYSDTGQIDPASEGSGAFGSQPKIVVLSWDHWRRRPVGVPTQSPLQNNRTLASIFDAGRPTCRSTSLPQRRMV